MGETGANSNNSEEGEIEDVGEGMGSRVQIKGLASDTCRARPPVAPDCITLPMDSGGDVVGEWVWWSIRFFSEFFFK